jgi:hypothetical protein
LKNGRRLLGVVFLFYCNVNALQFTQHLMLTGGTDGVGGRYSFFLGEHMTGKCGVTFDANGNLKLDEDGIRFWQNSYVTPFVGLYFFPYRNDRIRGSMGITFSAPIGDKASKYSDSTDASEISFEIAPSVEFFWFKNGKPRFAIEMGAIKFRPEENKNIAIELLCNISIFIKKIGAEGFRKRGNADKMRF